MAVEPEAYFDTHSRGPEPRIEAETVHPREFAQAGAVKELPVCTALGMITANLRWAEWDPNAVDGSEVLRGFVYDTPVTVSATGEKVGTVMLKGKIHRDDIIADLATSNELETELKRLSPSMRESGFDILGLAGVP